MKAINSNIGFADSSYENCFTDTNDLTVTLKSLDNKKIVITFFNILRYNYYLCNFISNIYEETVETPFLKEALSLKYKDIPPDLPFKEYLILDIEDTPIFQVVAENVKIIKI
jgi:hypothetical protein